MHHCLNCGTELEVRRVACPGCAVGFAGRFRLPRLARLAAAQQQLIEELILAETNLKDAAVKLDISYPTLRKRLDGLITALQDLREADTATERTLLDAVEDGSLRPEEAARQIKELHGGL